MSVLLGSHYSDLTRLQDLLFEKGWSVQYGCNVFYLIWIFLIGLHIRCMKKVTQQMSIHLLSKLRSTTRDQCNLTSSILVCGNKGIFWNTLSYLTSRITHQAVIAILVTVSGFVISNWLKKIDKCICNPGIGSESFRNSTASDVSCPSVNASLNAENIATNNTSF